MPYFREYISSQQQQHGRNPVSVRFERWKVDKKCKPTQKLKHANSILKSFEHLSQMLSKSILTISSYTISKLVRFFETQCIINDEQYHDINNKIA